MLLLGSDTVVIGILLTTVERVQQYGLRLVDQLLQHGTLRYPLVCRHASERCQAGAVDHHVHPAGAGGVQVFAMSRPVCRLYLRIGQGHDDYPVMVEVPILPGNDRVCLCHRLLGSKKILSNLFAMQRNIPLHLPIPVLRFPASME